MSHSQTFIQSKQLSELCTIGIGGPAEYYIEVKTIDAMQAVITTCKETNLRYFVLGKGSNTLFDDQGFKGLIIHNKIDFLEEESPGVFIVGAGYNFSRLGAQTAKNSWSGLEFASGIPGTVGGAIFMNAGANGTETCEHLTSVEFVTEDGELIRLRKSELEFHYRYSSFHNQRGAIVAATFTLIKKNDARKNQIDIIAYRTKTQPYGEKSAGCMFRNPEGSSAGALIEKCGLKGLKIGGAKVSTLHGNFITNSNNGKASDVLKLIQRIKNTVKEKSGLELESEVRYIPYSENNH